jgi:hypothetical protein
MRSSPEARRNLSKLLRLRVSRFPPRNSLDCSRSELSRTASKYPALIQAASFSTSASSFGTTDGRHFFILGWWPEEDANRLSGAAAFETDFDRHVERR